MDITLNVTKNSLQAAISYLASPGEH